eukprot:m.265629 g.265629  ORF g.265629 m.265629 type:complete len:348 (+) comp15627_c0_seq25:4835-5878(+)
MIVTGITHKYLRLRTHWSVNVYNFQQYATFIEAEPATVPTSILIVFVGIMFFLTFAIEFAIASLRCHSVRDRLIHAFNAVGTIAEGFCYTSMLTDAGKFYVDEPRPDFLSRCLGADALTADPTNVITPSFDSNGHIICTQNLTDGIPSSHGIYPLETMSLCHVNTCNGCLESQLSVDSIVYNAPLHLVNFRGMICLPDCKLYPISASHSHTHTFSLDQDAYLAFPSGHASSAVGSGLFLSLYLLWNISSRRSALNLASPFLRTTRNFLTAICFTPTIAGLYIAATRVADGRHSPADITAGAFLGTLVNAVWFVRLYTHDRSMRYRAAKHAVPQDDLFLFDAPKDQDL